ncbi:MAG: hypothetical protein H0U57_05385, partial [Tatlockia sp.]|nr:hypothetical protein [Tatlockia sp.]
MKMLIDKTQDSYKNVNPHNYLSELDLNLSNIKNNTILELNGETIGQVVIKGDVFYLKLHNNAPMLVVSDFPLQKKVLIETANAVKIKKDLHPSLEALFIEAGSIDYQANSSALQEINLVARDSLIISGSLHSEKIHCQAASFTNANKLEGKQLLSILAEKIEQNGELASKVLLLNGKSIVMDETSKIKVEESSAIFAHSALINGELNTGPGLICKVQELTIASPLNEVKEAYIVADTINLENKGSLEWNTRNSSISEIEASIIRVDRGAKFKLNRTDISVAEINSQGEVTLDQCNLTVKNLDLQGNYFINNSICNVLKFASLSGNNSTLNNLEFEAEHIEFSGKNKSQNVNFISDDLLFLEGNNSAFTDCSFDVQTIISLNEKAQSQLKNSFINTSTLNFSGQACLENCTVESDILNTSVNTTLNSSKILAAEFWQDAGAKINNCKIKAHSTTLLNEVDIQHSKLKTNSFSHVGTGKVADSKIYVFDYMHSSKESNLTFKHSYLESGQNYSQGILNLSEGSYHQCNYLQQSAGSITLNGSSIKSNNLIYTSDGAQLVTESKSSVEVKSALFEGKSSWDSAALSAIGPLVFCGKTRADSASITSKDSIFLTKNRHDLNKTVVKTEKDIIVSGAALDQSKLGCNRLIFFGQNNDLDKSQINANDLNILNQFSGKNSLINLQHTLETFLDSSTSLESTKINANSMKFGSKLTSRLSEFKAKENINFESAATSEFQTVKMVAGKAIINDINSQMTGTSLELKADKFANYGSIKIDKFSGQANSILNTSDIHSDQLQLKANFALVNKGDIDSKTIKIQAASFSNTFGRVHSSQSTTIQAPLVVNLLGKVISDGSLSIDSLTNFNLLGFENAYDLNIRSVYNFNYGLILPKLPASLKDAFTFSRG